MGNAVIAKALASTRRAPGLAACGAILLLAGCSDPQPPAEQGAPAEQATTPAATQESAGIAAPSGRYVLDPNHGSLHFRVNHFGLSNYVMRFTRFDVSLTLDAENTAASSVTVSLDPTSVETDYPSDYQATHGSRGFKSWDEELAQAPRFLNSAQYPEITFRSTQIEAVAPDKWRVTGDLTLVGQTHPVTLDVTLVGSVAAYRAANNRGALGLSATGTFQRSTFGMTSPPPMVASDEVTVQFEGELIQTAPDDEPAADAGAPSP